MSEPYNWYPPGTASMANLGSTTVGSTTPPGVGATDPYADIKAAYQQYLGRTPSEAELASHTGNGQYLQPQNISHAVSNIQNSPEAALYATRQNAPPPTTPPPGGNNGTGGTFTATGTGGAGAPGYAYTGFDFAQDAGNRDTGRSAKYAFAEATRQAAESGAGDIWKTKAGAQYFADTYIKPKLEAAGYQVLEIVGDKMRIVTREAAEAGNTEGVWIDFVVNAGGDNPALAWQEEAQRSAFGTMESRYDTSAYGQPPPTQEGQSQAGNTAGTNTTQSQTGSDMSQFAYQRLADPLADLTLY